MYTRRHSGERRAYSSARGKEETESIELRRGGNTNRRGTTSTKKEREEISR